MSDDQEAKKLRFAKVISQYHPDDWAAMKAAIDRLPDRLSDWGDDDDVAVRATAYPRFRNVRPPPPVKPDPPPPKPSPLRPSPDEGFVYLFQYRDFYKIGITRRFDQRFSALNTMPDAELILIHRFRTLNMRASEGKLHACFRAFRLRREWFALDQDAVDDFIAIKDYMLDD